MLAATILSSAATRSDPFWTLLDNLRTLREAGILLGSAAVQLGYLPPRTRKPSMPRRTRMPSVQTARSLPWSVHSGLVLYTLGYLPTAVFTRVEPRSYTRLEASRLTGLQSHELAAMIPMPAGAFDAVVTAVARSLAPIQRGLPPQVSINPRSELRVQIPIRGDLQRLQLGAAPKADHQGAVSGAAYAAKIRGAFFGAGYRESSSPSTSISALAMQQQWILLSLNGCK
ncbi:hypothetical protein ON010_g12180 [Phytophthora cinnamomi]|nr:hypothetical protein ON010_g12180 [Phytophthora cinnamomi]